MGSMVDFLQGFSQYLEINLILKMVFVYFVALWISLIIWITRDAINRSNNLIFQIFVIILNIFLPVFGLIIYLIIRPTKTLLEKYYEDLEYRALVDTGAEKEICRKCKTEISREYEFCPNCGDKLRQVCAGCKREFAKHWTICPYCGLKSEPPKESKEEAKPPKPEKELKIKEEKKEGKKNL